MIPIAMRLIAMSSEASRATAKRATFKDEFNNALKQAGDKLVVVDFHATWCGPCKMIAPKLVDMSKELPDVVFLKVDVDELEDVAAKYQVSCMPTFIFFKNGNKVHEFSGANAEKLRGEIERLK
ncbi:unnamed protein product [Cyprideis torosa]|uniref:Thioredoxin domain-containing protein n=1 Tax=Cyprideis torosa TaxID=163714 RepID=A0A7R8ZMM8_9CRUS|nr:unnamed protein product [Cyprideis torosa]CAG0884732.1 unnamed protein product [Cyprideis torosa]